MRLKALGLFIGLILVHNGRRIRLEKDLGDWVLGFVDEETGLDYLVLSDACDQPLRTTIDWLYAEKEAGRLVDPAEGSDHDARKRTFLGLDRAACIARDRKSAWRFRWAWAVVKDGPDTTSDDSYRDWIKTRPDLVPDEDGNAQPLPKPSSLRRWVRKLVAARGRRGALVSAAGRLKGQSPLPGLEDWLVQESAIYFWSAEEAPAILDAGAYYIEMRDRIADGSDEELKARLAENPVRLETVRKRVRDLEGAATTEAKEGARRARRMFEAAGEGVPVERFLERVEIDGMECRQIVNFAKDWPVPAGKMKLVNCIDSATSFWFFPAIFCGPYREEMTAVALRNVMMPPSHLSPEHLAKYPMLAEAWGTFDTGIPDNEKALMSPGTISAFTELGPDIELPKTNHPDGKPQVEALHRFLKAFLAGLPGTVRGPRHPKDPTRNAVKEAELTRAQFWAQIMNAWIYWNCFKRPQWGNLSPLDLIEEQILADQWPKRNTPGDVNRGLSKTHDGVEITRDGFEHDGIIYQSPELGGVLDANYHRTGFKDRVTGTSKIFASIRTNEGNLHEAEVFDEERKRYVPVQSTQPGYTQFLSRWEHNEFKTMTANLSPGKVSELERLRLRAGKLKQTANDLPKLSIKAAAKAAALLESDEVRRASGARASLPDFSAPTMHGVLATSGRDVRTDVPKPVRVPGAKRGPGLPNAPDEMLRSLGNASDGVRDNDDARATGASTGSEDNAEPADFVWPELPEDDADDDLDGEEWSDEQ